MLNSPSPFLKSPWSNPNSPSSTLLPPSSVRRTGFLTQKLLKIAWFPTECPQAPLAPLATFSRSAFNKHVSLCPSSRITLFWGHCKHLNFPLEDNLQLFPGLLQAEYKNIIPAIGSTDDFTLEFADGLFLKRNFSILDHFEWTLTFLGSDIKIMDFEDSEAAADTINDWVEERTKDKIKDLIQPDMIDEDTSLVLVNAIYFKSNWAKKFERT